MWQGQPLDDLGSPEDKKEIIHPSVGPYPRSKGTPEACRKLRHIRHIRRVQRLGNHMGMPDPRPTAKMCRCLLQGSEVIVASEVSTTDFTGQLFALKPSYFDDIRVDSMTVLRVESNGSNREFVLGHLPHVRSSHIETPLFSTWNPRFLMIKILFVWCLRLKSHFFFVNSPFLMVNSHFLDA